MQAKDLPERPILEFLSSVRERTQRAGTWFKPEDVSALWDNSVLNAMPIGTPPKVALAKMRALIKRGLVEGCGCGCRGDFLLTDKGRAALTPPPEAVRHQGALETRPASY